MSKIDPTLDDGGVVFKNGVEFNFWKYGNMFHGTMSFTDFVRATTSIPDEEADIHFSSQYHHLTDADGSLVPDFIGRFESLAHDLAEICERLKMGEVLLPHMLKTDHEHYSQYYTRETQAIVEEGYPRDIELFGFQFESGPQQPHASSAKS